ncbi:helix-turn-helix transcriptional regulator [Neptuniibacter sp. QD72_48]|uniref:helix-turn-helix transcriptional regulator n=1 Tax=Neptuniibacter sp. QD72_48 TaxID=3398214 RepID=UPI0039F5CC70
MRDYEFTLKFALPDADIDPSTYVEQLGEAGCDDALIGLGHSGRIALQFTREAKSASEAVITAIEDVKSVIPNAQLFEATPDMVGVSDIAEIIGVSRQNIRKLVMNHGYTFPVPVYAGSSSLWHLSTVLEWFETEQNKTIEPTIKEIAFTNMQVNLVKESHKLDPIYSSKLSFLNL